MGSRILKESITTSDDINGLSWFEECFFYRLMVICDDFGRYDARPAILKARMFPLKAITDKQVSDALNKLSSAGIVTTYTVEAKPYLQIVAWEKHQQVRNKREKYPSPDKADGNLKSNDFNCNQVKSDDCLRAHAQNSNPNPNTNPNTNSITPLTPLKRVAYVESEKLNDAILEFIEHRKKLKKPMTDKAIKLLINKLYKMTPSEDTQIAILQQSILGGWSGIYELSKEKGSSSKAQELSDFYAMANDWAERGKP